MPSTLPSYAPYLTSLILTPLISSLHSHHPPPLPYTYARARNFIWKNSIKIEVIFIIIYLDFVRFLFLSRVSFEMREFLYLSRARYLITRMFVSAYKTLCAKISNACWSAITIQDRKFFSLLFIFFVHPKPGKGTHENQRNETPMSFIRGNSENGKKLKS